MTQLSRLNAELRSLGSPAKSRILQRFFRTGKGEYGEGDIFLGITVPVSRRLAQRYRTLRFADTARLLASPYHEARLVALLILVHNFQAGSSEQQEKIYSFYLRHTRYINNWDLVDLTADKIVGVYLLNRSRKVLDTLARSKNLWERRIAIIATFQFIKRDQSADALRIARILLTDQHDLIHKAVGWMLREVGKRVSLPAERAFLDQYGRRMPRTMLRYAIERMPEHDRIAYLRTSSAQ